MESQLIFQYFKQQNLQVLAKTRLHQFRRLSSTITEQRWDWKSLKPGSPREDSGWLMWLGNGWRTAVYSPRRGSRLQLKPTGHIAPKLLFAGSSAIP